MVGKISSRCKHNLDVLHLLYLQHKCKYNSEMISNEYSYLVYRAHSLMQQGFCSFFKAKYLIISSATNKPAQTKLIFYVGMALATFVCGGYESTQIDLSSEIGRSFAYWPYLLSCRCSKLFVWLLWCSSV